MPERDEQDRAWREGELRKFFAALHVLKERNEPLPLTIAGSFLAQWEALAVNAQAIFDLTDPAQARDFLRAAGPLSVEDIQTAARTLARSPDAGDQLIAKELVGEAPPHITAAWHEPVYPTRQWDGESGEMVGCPGLSVRAYLAAHSTPLPDDVSADHAEALAGRSYVSRFGTAEHWQFWADAEAGWKVMQADALLRALKGGA